MGVKHFHFGFWVVKLVLRNYGILNMLIFDQPIPLLLEMNNFNYCAKVAEHIVQVSVAKLLGNWAYEQDFARAVFF